MRERFLAALFLFAALRVFSQTAPTAQPDLPKDPREILAMAAPLYDFNDAALKPWHLKATYKLYDEKGKPSEQGTFEYWWASPTVFRRSWTRPGATHTDWHTADGKYAYKATGGPLEYFEYKVQFALLSPLPDSKELDPVKTRLDREIEPVFAGAKSPCIMIIPLMPQHGQVQDVPMGLFPTYCFDIKLPALRVGFSWGALATQFNHIVKVQGKYLAEEILFSEGGRTILSARVDTVEGLSLSDVALVPPPDAKTPGSDKTAQIAPAVMVGMLIKKQQPIYPQDAKDARASGTVVLRAMIGMDGGIHDLHVESAPWPSLAASALWAVSHWQYKPYLLNGELVDVETTINVIYSLGN
jgi:TonB family protein